jgi:predicted dinucleotide-binding enzyme
MSNALPTGWDEERVRQVLAHYESQSEDEQFAEIEAAFEQEDVIVMAVPARLAAEIRALIAREHTK